MVMVNLMGCACIAGGSGQAVTGNTLEMVVERVVVHTVVMMAVSVERMVPWTLCNRTSG